MYCVMYAESLFALYLFIYHILPCIMHIRVFGPNFQGEKILHFNFLIQFFIYLYLDTCFLYYKRILASIFEYIIVQEILYYK